MALAKNSFTNTMMGSPNTALNSSDYTVGVGVNSTNIGVVGGTSGQVWTTNNSWISPAPTLVVDQTGTIDLRGDKADIRVNGESLMETLRAIQDHLNMLRPNPALEAEWDELRELGEQYRKLEAEFKEKSKMWNTLKKK